MGKTVAKPPKKAEATLDEISDLMRQGKLSQIPSTLSLDLNTISKEQYWTLMELLRHHPFGGSLIKRQHELENIVELRNLVNGGKLSDAESRLKGCETRQRSRSSIGESSYSCFSGRYSEAIALCLLCLAETGLEMTTRGVMSQLAGHAFLEVGELNTLKLISTPHWTLQRASEIQMVKSQPGFSSLNRPLFESRFDRSSSLRRQCSSNHH